MLAFGIFSVLVFCVRICMCSICTIRRPENGWCAPASLKAAISWMSPPGKRQTWHRALYPQGKYLYLYFTQGKCQKWHQAQGKYLSLYFTSGRGHHTYTPNTDIMLSSVACIRLSIWWMSPHCGPHGTPQCLQTPKEYSLYFQKQSLGSDRWIRFVNCGNKHCYIFIIIRSATQLWKLQIVIPNGVLQIATQS